MPSKTIVAMGCITAIIMTSIFNGLDGFIVGTGVAVIASLGGFAYGRFKKP